MTHTHWKTIHGLCNEARPPTLNNITKFNNHTQTYCEPFHQTYCEPFHQTYCEPFHQTILKHCQTRNRSIDRATQNIQGYNITLTTTQVQEAIKQSIIKTIVLALCYSNEEYSATVWVRFSHAYILDPELNKTCRAFTGSL